MSAGEPIATDAPATSRAPRPLVAFVVAFVPLAGLVLPLFFHRSPIAAIGRYSREYATVLAGCCGLALLLLLAISA